MTFKNNWEKTTEHFQIAGSIIQRMLEMAFPEQQHFSYDILLGGCANLNIKFTHGDNSGPLLLRIYLRDKEAAFREEQLARLVHYSVPIPQIYYIGEFEDYRFAITEYMPGVSLRDLLLSNQIDDMHGIMQEVGLILAKIQSHRFARSGFFDRHLQLRGAMTRNGFAEYARECLNDPIVLQQLPEEVFSKICICLDKFGYLYPSESANHLVHADFDPANILVKRVDSKWKISAVLDWEFAFSGSPLCDMANMLRYAHHMPPIFEAAFLEGVQKGGVDLPEHWRLTVHMLNLLSLLDCLRRCPPQVRPNQCKDILETIAFIVDQL